MLASHFWNLSDMSYASQVSALVSIIERLRGLEFQNRDRELVELAQARPALQGILTQKRQRWQSLWSLWRARVRTGQLSSLMLGCDSSSDAREIATGLANFWSAVAESPSETFLSERLTHPVKREVASFSVKIEWPEPPVFTIAECKEFLASRPCSSPGPDGIRYAHLLQLGDGLGSLATDLLQAWIADGSWNPSLSASWFVALPKPHLDVCPGPGDIRPIALSSCLGKLVIGLLTSWLSTVVPPFLSELQHGFLRGRDTTSALLSVERMALCNSSGGDDRAMFC